MCVTGAPMHRGQRSPQIGSWFRHAMLLSTYCLARFECATFGHSGPLNSSEPAFLDRAAIDGRSRRLATTTFCQGGACLESNEEVIHGNILVSGSIPVPRYPNVRQDAIATLRNISVKHCVDWINFYGNCVAAGGGSSCEFRYYVLPWRGEANIATVDIMSGSINNGLGFKGTFAVISSDFLQEWTVSLQSASVQVMTVNRPLVFENPSSRRRSTVTPVPTPAPSVLQDRVTLIPTQAPTPPPGQGGGGNAGPTPAPPPSPAPSTTTTRPEFGSNAAGLRRRRTTTTRAPALSAAQMAANQKAEKEMSLMVGGIVFFVICLCCGLGAVVYTFGVWSLVPKSGGARGGDKITIITPETIKPGSTTVADGMTYPAPSPLVTPQRSPRVTPQRSPRNSRNLTPPGSGAGSRAGSEAPGLRHPSRTPPRGSPRSRDVTPPRQASRTPPHGTPRTSQHGRELRSVSKASQHSQQGLPGIPMKIDLQPAGFGQGVTASHSHSDGRHLEPGAVGPHASSSRSPRFAGRAPHRQSGRSPVPAFRGAITQTGTGSRSMAPSRSPRMSLPDEHLLRDSMQQHTSSKGGLQIPQGSQQLRSASKSSNLTPRNQDLLRMAGVSTDAPPSR
eukprot:TRINITY_DN19030_c0_g1_i1.p1 TRINITY_DN19030_c0_g1~~TRINITY_DN19030_c0_g1_i1.p1  ORF type:complete len:618 (+),score=54.61 TRINITY_DN19030_c0_g1_i1:96-1949(+)